MLGEIILDGIASAVQRVQQVRADVIQSLYPSTEQVTDERITMTMRAIREQQDYRNFLQEHINRIYRSRGHWPTHGKPSIDSIPIDVRQELDREWKEMRGW